MIFDQLTFCLQAKLDCIRFSFLHSFIPARAKHQEIVRFEIWISRNSRTWKSHVNTWPYHVIINDIRGSANSKKIHIWHLISCNFCYTCIRLLYKHHGSCCEESCVQNTQIQTKFLKMSSSPPESGAFCQF